MTEVRGLDGTWFAEDHRDGEGMDKTEDNQKA